MSLSIVHPNKVCHLEEFKWKVTGGNAASTEGVAGDRWFSILVNPVADDIFVVTWPLDEVEFTFKATPDDSGFQLSLKSGGQTQQEFIDQVIEELSANFTIFSNFIVARRTTNPLMITLTARETGSNYVLTYSETGTMNISQGVDVVAVDEVLLDYYKIGAMIFDSSDNILASDTISLDDNDEALFDFGEVVKAELLSEFTKEGDVGSTMLREDLNMCQGFYVKYYEFYGDPPTAKILNKSNTRCCLNGGISKWQQSIFNDEGDSFYELLEDQMPFLTFQPREKTVAYLQQERLYLLLTNTATSRVNLYANAAWTDGSATLSQFIGSANPSIYYSVFELICSPEKIRDYFSGTKTLKSFDVRLYDDTTGLPVSEFFNYIIDYNYYSNNRFFIFRNSLGTFDTIRTTGETIKNAADKFQLLSSFLDVDFGTTDHQNNRDRAEEVISYKANTGWLKDRQTADYMRELFLSEEVYEIIQDHLMPIRIISNKARIFEDNEFGYNIDFEFEQAYTNKYYSNIQERKNSKGDYFGDGFGNGFPTAEDHQGILQQNSNTYK